MNSNKPKKDNHGGKRLGAGRKPGKNKKKVTFEIKLSAINELERLAKVYNRPKTQIVEDAIDNFEKK
jgi:hypothetical protein